MAYQGRTGIPVSKTYSTDGDIALRHIRQYLVLQTSTGGLQLELEDPKRALEACYSIFHNNSSGFTFLYSANGWEDGRDTLVVPPYSAVKIGVASISNDSWQWYAEQLAGPRVQSYTPTATFGTGTPTATVNTCYYCIVDGTLFFSGYYLTADGDDSDSLTLTFPAGIFPYAIGCDVPIEASKVIDDTTSDAMGYIDAGQSAVEDRLIKFYNFETWTATKGCSMNYSGFVELWGWTAFTPTVAWTTGTPQTNTSTVARYKVLDEKVVLWHYWTTADDGNGATQVALEPPLPTPDNDSYIAAKALEKVDATWSNPIAQVDQASATMADRDLTCLDFTTATGSQAFEFAVACIQELQGWQSYTPTETWDTAPASVSAVARYHAYGPLCFLNAYFASTDGNDASTFDFSLPAPPRADCVITAFNAYEIQHTDTFVNPLGWIDCDDSDISDRNCDFANMTAADDGEAIKFNASWFYII